MDDQFLKKLGSDLRAGILPRLDSAQKYLIIRAFLDHFKVESHADLRKARLKTSDGRRMYSMTAIFEKFVRSKMHGGYLGDHPNVHRRLGLTGQNVDLVLRGTVDEKMRGHYRSDRSIRVLDSEGKEVSFTSKRKSETVLVEGRATRVDETTIMLKHVVEGEALIRRESAFQKLMKRQNFDCHCDLCKKKIDESEAEIHHKYIPRSLKLYNAMWNLELLCSDCHRQRHEEWFITAMIRFAKEWKKIKKALKKSEFRIMSNSN